MKQCLGIKWVLVVETQLERAKMKGPKTMMC
jgi:hypothetical protein